MEDSISAISQKNTSGRKTVRGNMFLCFLQKLFTKPLTGTGFGRKVFRLSHCSLSVWAGGIALRTIV